MTTDGDDVENLAARAARESVPRARGRAGGGVADIERQGQRLLAELAAGLDGARRYATPFGARERTPELVRAAIAELRDPARRLVHEWWARGLAAAS